MRYGATPLGWCCHASLHGNTSRDHAGVGRRVSTVWEGEAAELYRDLAKEVLRGEKSREDA